MVLAHAGGIDEILLIILPLFVFTFTYRLARGKLPETKKQDSPT
jgi:hypothetical protein